MDSMHDAVLAWLKEGRALARQQPSSSSSGDNGDSSEVIEIGEYEAAVAEAAQADARLFANIISLNSASQDPLNPAAAAAAAAATIGTATTGTATDSPVASVAMSHFSWGFRGATPLFRDLSYQLAPGSRCLLTGANGAGKTTLLAILGGSRLPIGHNDPTIVYDDDDDERNGGNDSAAVEGATEGAATATSTSQENGGSAAICRKGVTIVPSPSQVRVCDVDPGVNYTAANQNTVHVSIAWRRSLAEVLKGGAEQKFGDLFGRALDHALADLSALLRGSSSSEQQHAATSSPLSSLSAASPAQVEVTEKEEQLKAALGRRAARLVTCLGVKEDWVISKLSAGQKARVQLALQLLRPKKVKNSLPNVHGVLDENTLLWSSICLLLLLFNCHWALGSYFFRCSSWTKSLLSSTSKLGLGCWRF